MALELKDRIYTNCSTIGEADIEIGAPKEGYQGWEAITDGSTVYYCITDDTAWEVGYGVKTGTNIVRNLLTSNTGSLLSLNGNSSVFCTYPAEKAVFLNLDDNIEIPNSNINAKKFSGDGGGITNINAETNNLAPEAPNDGETYARNNKTWVSISDSAGIPDAPVDGLQYGRQDGEWTEVESGTNGYTKAEIDAQQNAQDVNITANTNAIANLPSPVDTYTKAEINASQDAQDVEIAKKANTSDTYTKAATDTLLDSKANVGDSYTKAETYSSVEVDGKLFEKADKTTTYTKTEVDNSQDAQDTNISNNTSAIGTLSGRVSANEQDIATLQDGIFFSSSYTTDYPSNPNRDPETGNIYLQDLSAFTYSYADANQVFISKTDEQGNVRQFTAVKPDDILVLNQVESPNYGRYKVSSVNDVGDYVNVIVEFQVGEGTVLEGDTLALQAFPASEGGTGGGIPEAPIDGKQYGRQDATWTEVTGGGTAEPMVWENKKAERAYDTVYTNTKDCPIYVQPYLERNSTDRMYVQFKIDGDLVFTEGGESISFNSPMFVVPSGSTYELVNTVTGTALKEWFEANVSGGASSGGGSYTPEPLVWKHVNSSKTVNTDYVNTNDTPLLVQFGLDISNPTGSANYAEFLIDGNVFGGNGKNTTLGTTYTSPSFTVPAGSTYQLRSTVTDGTVVVSQWREAKMPLAIGTGGKTVAFRGEISARQTGITAGAFTKVNLNEASVDTDTALTDGKFKPSVAGYYNVNFSIGDSSTPNSPETFPILYKNGNIHTYGSNVHNADTIAGVSNGSDVVYLNGTTDYLELYCYLTSSGSCELSSDNTITYLSAVLVTGGSGGGSYTPESLVWEDKKLENDFDVLYTNDSDVPRYVEISLTCLEDTEYAYANFLIDGKYHASMGKRGSGIRDMSQGMFIVPAGSTYNLEKDGSVVIGTWWEARMPVAVGTGGDSIWSDVDGDAVLETDGKKLTIDANVGELGLKSRITTDASILELKAGSGGIPDVTIADSGFTYSSSADTNMIAKANSGQYATYQVDNSDQKYAMQIRPDQANAFVIRNETSGQNSMSIATDGKVTTQQDMVVNGMTVGASSSQKNTFIGKNALASRTNGMFVVAVGEDALKNSAEGGAYNTAIGYNAGGDLTTGSNVTCIGYQAQASSPSVTNEVTIGNDDVTSTRLKGQVTMNDNLTINTGDLKIPNIAEAGTPANVYISGAGTIHRSTASTYTTEEVDKKLAIKDKLIEKLSARLDELEKKVK